MPSDIAGLGGVSYSPELEEKTAEQESKKELKQREREAAEQAELDRVLEKISVSGMDSLNASERRLLAKQTKKRQRD